MKKALIIAVALCSVQLLAAQIGEIKPLGVSSVGQKEILGASELPRCSESSACSTVEYIFTGNGLWTDAANWRDGVVPPAILRAGKIILINPIANGECRLNVMQTIAHGATLTVLPFKRFSVSSDLIFLKN